MDLKLFAPLPVAVFLLVLVGVSSTFGAGESTAFYVSPSGDDGAFGTREKPFRTLDRARDAVKAATAGGAQDFAVILRGGTYYLTEPFVLGEEDSGADGCTVTYRNYPGEQPVLIGGLRITGWQRFHGPVFRASVPALKTGARVNQLLEDGVVGFPARTPNEGWFRFESPRKEKDGYSFQYRHGDFDPVNWTTDDLEVVYIRTGAYSDETLKVDSIDFENRRIYTGYRPGDPAYNWYWGHSYYMKGALAMLDMAGEFYAEAATGYLYYWPRSRDIAAADVVLGTQQPIIKAQSVSPDRPIRGIVFEGLTLEGGGNQVELENAHYVTIRNCRMFDAEGAAIYVSEASSNNTITGCEITGCGGNGIDVRGIRGQPPVSHDNLIHNNYIHHTGRLTVSGFGVVVQASAHNTISHNLITDIPWVGISAGSDGWGASEDESAGCDNIIRNNELARLSTTGWDGGGICTGPSAWRTLVDNNRSADNWDWLVETWPQPGAGSNNCAAIATLDAARFDGTYGGSTVIRNNLFLGQNGNFVEISRDEGVTTVTNNYFENPQDDWFALPDQVANEYYNGAFYLRMDGGEFDKSRVSMDVGLTEEYTFPYPREVPRPITFPMAAGFDGTLSPFHLYRYSGGPAEEYFTTSRTHAGGMGLTVDKDVFVVRYRHPLPLPSYGRDPLPSRKVTVWMYDDPSMRSADCMATVRGFSGTSYAAAGIGVDGQVSQDKYVIQDRRNIRAPAGISRRRGWHKLEFSFRSWMPRHPDNGCIMSLDGVEIGRAPEMWTFTIVDLGDPSFGTDSRGLGFDSLTLE